MRRLRQLGLGGLLLSAVVVAGSALTVTELALRAPATSAGDEILPVPASGPSPDGEDSPTQAFARRPDAADLRAASRLRITGTAGRSVRVVGDFSGFELAAWRLSDRICVALLRPRQPASHSLCEDRRRVERDGIRFRVPLGPEARQQTFFSWAPDGVATMSVPG